MTYMGSKSKLAGNICPLLQRTIKENGVNTYIECFVGGANIIDKIKCEHRFGYDRSDTLIALLRQAADDFDQVLKEGSRELWDKGKAYVKDGIMPEDMTLADIGAMEFLGSFSAGGFPRGYAKTTTSRNPYQERYIALQKQAPALKGIEFGCQNYWELEPVSGAVIYLDPPYAGTKPYGYANQPKMDYDHFWNWVRELSKDNYVFISEQSAPDDFEIIWHKEVTRTNCLNNDFSAVEKLFRYKDGLK